MAAWAGKGSSRDEAERWGGWEVRRKDRQPAPQVTANSSNSNSQREKGYIFLNVFSFV